MLNKRCGRVHAPHVLVPRVPEAACKAALPCLTWLHSPEDQQPGVIRGRQWSLEDRPGSGMTWDSSGVHRDMNKGVNFL